MTRRLLVVSHPCVATVNQLPYVELQRRGWAIHLVVPDRWKTDFRPDGFGPDFLTELEEQATTLPILWAGAPQRHVYRARLGPIIDRIVPDVAFVEQEPIAVAAAQWLRVLRSRDIPVGLQHAENLDRPLPATARAIRAIMVKRVAFFAARSPTASALISRYRPGVPAPVVPHAVPLWDGLDVQYQRHVGAPEFTVGFAGRLVVDKGVRDLVAATAAMRPGVRLAFFGNGELRSELAAASTVDRQVDVITHVTHHDMHRAYAEMDVLVLPSRTTTTWTEQFGRVLVEAMWCGRPVVASDSGEMKWVVETTGGGQVFPEGDVAALAATLEALRDHPERRAKLAEAGRAAVERTFSVPAVASVLEAALSSALERRRG